MNRSLKLLAAALCVTAMATSLAFAAERGRLVSQQEKATSDQHVADGLAQEQAALAAFGTQGGAATTSSDLQAAVADMHQALPIYHGYRARSMAVAAHAAKELGVTPKNPAKAIARITAQINAAIADAKTALSNSENFITEEDRERPQ